MAKRFLTPISLYSSSSDPENGAEGQIYFNTSSDALKIYYNSSWMVIPSKEAVEVSDTPPSNPVTGTIWFESDTGDTFIYYDQTWVQINSSLSAYIDDLLPSQTGNSGKYLTTDGASESWGQIIISDIEGLQNSLDDKAPLSSPALSGTPTAPTAALGTNTTQIATTAFVQSATAALVDSAPTTLDTLNELAAALGDDPNFATTVSNSLGNKQPLDADLTAIAALTGTSGLLKKTAADTWTLDTTAYTTNTGTVTSVAVTVPTGLSVSGTPVTTSGTIAISLASGYTIPTTTTLDGKADKSGKLSQFAATTSAELAGVINDETGSGALVFATSPSLTTPNIGSASGASLSLTGSLTAASKSFDIEHPTKEGMRLRYGSLEGEEHGVYIRGKSNSFTITLPDYWTGLVDEDSITVQVTPIGRHKNLYVKDISNNTVTIGGCRGEFEFFYFIQAERKDIDKLVVEYGG